MISGFFKPVLRVFIFLQAEVIVVAMLVALFLQLEEVVSIIVSGDGNVGLCAMFH